MLCSGRSTKFLIFSQCSLNFWGLHYADSVKLEIEKILKPRQFFLKPTLLDNLHANRNGLHRFRSVELANSLRFSTLRQFGEAFSRVEACISATAMQRVLGNSVVSVAKGRKFLKHWAVTCRDWTDLEKDTKCNLCNQCNQWEERQHLMCWFCWHRHFQSKDSSDWRLTKHRLKTSEFVFVHLAISDIPRTSNWHPNFTSWPPEPVKNLSQMFRCSSSCPGPSGPCCFQAVHKTVD